MDGVDMIIGAHLWSPLAVGSVGVKAGALMAAPDAFRIVVLGSGGHAALPQQTVDPIVVAAQVVTNLQHVVARNVDPLQSAVVSVTRIMGGGEAYNIIPGRVELSGTVRVFDASLRDRLPGMIERIVAGVTAAHGARYEFAYERGYRPVINDAAAAELVRRAVERALGSGALVEATPTMGGEDFSAYQQKAPGAFFFVGARNEERGIVQPHHHECFDVDEVALDHGTRVFVAAAELFQGLAARG
jgi:amidohydrolase